MVGLVRNQKGQSLIEYVVLVALVGVGTMGLVRVLQKTVNVNVGRVVNALQGKEDRPQHEALKDDDFRKKDFSDFMNGAVARDGKK